ncbi:MAG TPA: apolipoprotein N-acyltransferase [Caulobacteraceae bacterium]|nr:apolipoprotein N-acyltransferase [Caulobacteraceae bacterium]
MAAEPTARGRWRGAIVVGLALIAGLGVALAFPPFRLLPGLLGFALLMALVERADPRRPLKSAFWRGWVAGVGFFAVSTWWISEAFQVDAAEQGWMAPFAVALIAAGFALFWACGALLYRLAAARGVLRVLVFAGVFAAVEWLRGNLLTGFPWDLAGESWPAGSPLSQGAALVGAYGLSWITLAAASAAALLVDERGPLRGGLACIAAGLALGGLWLFGQARLASPAAPDPRAPLVRIVQANLPEVARYDAASYAATVHALLDLTTRPAQRAPDIVVWPERAIPGEFDSYLAPGTWTRDAITAALKPGQILITGGYRSAVAPAGAYAPEGLVYFNSLLAIRNDPGGLQPLARYDKYRLVPFGEYMPLARYVRPLHIEEIVHVGDGFSHGPPPRAIELDGAPPVQPLICYEALYPGFTRSGAIASGVRPAWIVNVSDDAWFGGTYGPIQHLNLASYRAIEEGLPMVRATPTGVSAVVDAYGRSPARLRLPQGRAGVIDALLPPALPPTAFDRWGEGPFVLMLLGSLIAAVFASAHAPRAVAALRKRTARDGHA